MVGHGSHSHGHRSHGSHGTRHFGHSHTNHGFHHTGGIHTIGGGWNQPSSNGWSQNNTFGYPNIYGGMYPDMYGGMNPMMYGGMNPYMYGGMRRRTGWDPRSLSPVELKMYSTRYKENGFCMKVGGLLCCGLLVFGMVMFMLVVTGVIPINPFVGYIFILIAIVGSIAAMVFLICFCMSHSAYRYSQMLAENTPKDVVIPPVDETIPEQPQIAQPQPIQEANIPENVPPHEPQPLQAGNVPVGHVPADNLPGIPEAHEH